MTEFSLDSFGSNSKAIIIGASGGIGSAFVNHLKSSENVIAVHEFSRSQNGFDLTDEQSIKSAADTIANNDIDLIIIATGYLGNSPEKSLKDISTDKFNQVFTVNTFGPALVMKHFASKLTRNRKSVMASISARVGSISDNHLGGWYAYRASKSALNMIIKTTSIEIARTHKQSAIIGLHPGTVDTSLSKPFQDHVPNDKLFTPEYSTACMLRTLNQIDATNTGEIFAYNGQKIDY